MPLLYSIGHGNRTLEAFLALLQVFHIKVLADIRSYPGSRRNPHFNQKNLEQSLPKTGILYVWLSDLGGFRRKGLGPESPHAALLSPGFRNYADHMDTEAFQAAVPHLCSLATKDPTCFMCAETPPQRCHRLLLADYLLVKGIQVVHIMDEKRLINHRLSRLARIKDGRLIYDHSPPFDYKRE